MKHNTQAKEMNAVPAKDDMKYTNVLKREIERIVLRGNLDKETIRVIAMIIFDIEQRLINLEKQ